MGSGRRPPFHFSRHSHSPDQMKASEGIRATDYLRVWTATRSGGLCVRLAPPNNGCRRGSPNSTVSAYTPNSASAKGKPTSACADCFLEVGRALRLLYPLPASWPFSAARARSRPRCAGMATCSGPSSTWDRAANRRSVHCHPRASIARFTALIQSEPDCFLPAFRRASLLWRSLCAGCLLHGSRGR